MEDSIPSLRLIDLCKDELVAMVATVEEKLSHVVGIPEGYVDYWKGKMATISTDEQKFVLFVKGVLPHCITNDSGERVIDMKALEANRGKINQLIGVVKRLPLEYLIPLIPESALRGLGCTAAELGVVLAELKNTPTEFLLYNLPEEVLGLYSNYLVYFVCCYEFMYLGRRIVEEV